MRSIREIVGVGPASGQYGVEIEVEGTRLPSNLGKMWRVERDGSLRGESFEYVMPKPLDVDGVWNSLSYLKAKYDEHESIVNESIRAGVHVHMNVQNWNIKQLMTFVTAYYILEDVLMNWCGPDREGNLFTLRTKDAEFIIFRLLKALESKNLKHLNNDVIRYSSLNFCSMFKYGSIEFRGMRGTGDLDTIMNWVRIIDDLRNSSLKFDNPNDIMAMMSGDGGLSFFEYMLPNTHQLFVKNGIDKSVKEAARRIQIIAYTVDWNGLNSKSINPFVQEGF